MRAGTQLLLLPGGNRGLPHRSLSNGGRLVKIPLFVLYNGYADFDRGLLGRFVCGFLCPFGWLQDLLHKIPGKKLSTKKVRPLTYIKYAVLAVAVVLLPALVVNDVGLGDPFLQIYMSAGRVRGSNTALYCKPKHSQCAGRAVHMEAGRPRDCSCIKHNSLPPVLQVALSFGRTVCPV